MSFTYLLHLASVRGGQTLRGASKDPNWPGWIPVQAFGMENSGVAIGSSGGARTPSPESPGQEYQFKVNSEDLDLHAMYRWVLNGESLTGKLNAVPAAVGEDGFQYVFENALISAYQPRPDTIYFSLNANRVERRYLMRYR